MGGVDRQDTRSESGPTCTMNNKRNGQMYLRSNCKECWFDWIKDVRSSYYWVKLNTTWAIYIMTEKPKGTTRDSNNTPPEEQDFEFVVSRRRAS